MKFLVIILTSLSLILTSCSIDYETKVMIERIEDGVVSIEVLHKDEIWFYEVFEDELNSFVKDGDTLNFTQVNGKFYHNLDCKDYQGNPETLFQFRSDDNSVWWLLTAEEIGEIPNFTDTYTLIFYDNGTTTENKPCDCIPEWECECELYDDIFLGVHKNG